MLLFAFRYLKHKDLVLLEMSAEQLSSQKTTFVFEKNLFTFPRAVMLCSRIRFAFASPTFSLGIELNLPKIPGTFPQVHEATQSLKHPTAWGSNQALVFRFQDA